MAVPQHVLDAVRTFFSEAIPFNSFLKFHILEIEPGRVVAEVPFLPQYVGDVRKRIVHGGLVSAFIDATGGATAFSVLDPMRESSLNTVDMRVDYVRMGRGERFVATGTVIRKGNRLCVTSVEVVDDEGVLIARGTAVYSIFAAR